MLQLLRGLFTTPEIGGIMPTGTRSSHWTVVQQAHLERFPTCAACGCSTRKLLNVHHVRPFHLFPALELDPDNLVTLCESPSHNCHLIFGHLLLWAAWNPQVRVSAANYLLMVQTRPMAA